MGWQDAPLDAGQDQGAQPAPASPATARSSWMDAPVDGAAPTASPDIQTMTVRPSPASGHTADGDLSGMVIQPPVPGAPPVTSGHQQPGMMQSLGEGLATPFLGAAQAAEHLMPINGMLHALGVPGVKSTEELDKALNDRHKELIAEDDGHINWARMAGEVVNPINYVGPYATEMSGLSNLARSTLGSMWSAAMRPVDTEKEGFVRGKIKQIAEGAVAGVATNAAGKVLSQAIAPGDATLLAKEGIRLTPGQNVGGLVRRGEEALRSVPLLGAAIRHGEDITRGDFNVAVYNRALEPLGEKYSGKAIGTEGVDNLRQQISAAYDRVLPHVQFRADQNLANDFNNLRQLAGEMPPDQVRQFNNIAIGRVYKRLQPTGTMDGRTFKQVESELTHKAAGMHSSGDAAQRQLGDAVDELNQMLRQNLARQNPAQRAELEANNKAWMMYARVRRAASNRVTSNGEFTPTDLLAALKASDKSPGKGQFATGRAPMQDLAASGSNVIRNKMADSGTPERQMWGHLATGGAVAGGAYGVSHGVDPMWLAAGIPAIAPYNGPAMSLLRGATTGTAGVRGALSNSDISPWLSPMAGAISGYGQ